MTRRGATVCTFLAVSLVGMLALKCWREVTMSQREFDAGVALMRTGNFGDAKERFVTALKAGGIDEVAVLGKIAECQIALGDTDALMITAAALRDADGGAAKSHAVRGAALELRGNDVGARVEYEASYALGNHVAGASLERISRKAHGAARGRTVTP